MTSSAVEPTTIVGLRTVRTDVEATEAGHAARRILPRKAHGELLLAPGRDPRAILDAQNASRQQDLIDLRWERMLTDPFAFYRGTAAIMAADLAAAPDSGFDVVACGDAHLANFGFFASPQRTLLFDLNDFDEAGIAPWEWDVKRLATSVVMGANANGYGSEGALHAAAAAVRAYRQQVAAMAELTVLERYFFFTDVEQRVQASPKRARRILDQAIEKARQRTSDRVAARLTTTRSDGSRRFVDNPPVLVHAPEKLASADTLISAYLRTVEPDIAALLTQFVLDDAARRVVGVGSVGTRCYLLALRGPSGEPLILQIKEAVQSVLESHGGRAQLSVLGAPGTPTREAHRVVTHQHVLQAASDPFLGYFALNGHDYYVRQFHDMKGGIDVAGLRAAEYESYAVACGRLLARGHAQSANITAIAGYLGASDSFDNAVARWSLAYADQATRDFETVRATFDR